MKKKYFPFLTILFVFVFSFCSSDKEAFTEKPKNDQEGIPDSNIEDGFTLLPKNHIPNSDLYLEGGLLINQNDNSQFNKINRKWQGIPSVGKDRSGNLFCGWVSGGPGEGNENYITVSLSLNQGKTWDHDKLIVYVNPKDSTRVTDPCFFNDKFGNLYMAWHKYVQKKKSITKEWAIVWYTKIEFSDKDASIHFTPPRRIAEGSLLNKPFYSEVSDQIFFPIARWYEGNAVLHQPFIYRGNYGKNFLTNFSKIGSISVDPSIMGIHEHMIVQLKDRTYFGMVRTFDGIYYSRSIDGAKWDMSKKFKDLGDTTVSRFHLAKLKSGRLIFIFNNSLVRSNLMIFLSEDDGVTWPYKMTLDGSNHVSAPDMIETDPGVINIVYDFSRYIVRTINFVRLEENIIINKNYSNVYRTKISTFQ